MEEGKSANRYHILARGDSHMPFAEPNFGTPCAATEKRKVRVLGSQMNMPMGDKGKIVMNSLNVTGTH